MSKLITLTRIKDRELYRHCESIEEMLSALEEEIIELEDLEEKGVKVKPVETGLLILTVDVEGKWEITTFKNSPVPDSLEELFGEENV